MCDKSSAENDTQEENTMSDMFADMKGSPKDPSSAAGGGSGPFEILYRGTNSMLKARLNSGEALKAESGAMVAMSPTIDVEGKMEGGLLGGIGRVFSGESFFFQTLRATRGSGEVFLAPASIGDIVQIDMDGSKDYILQKDGFFAGSESISVHTKMQNLAKGFFSGEGFFILRVSGSGTLFASSYGAIHELSLKSGEDYIIDNSHLVAWPADVVYNVEKASKGWISSFTSGEGLVCRFRGPGKVYIQTRNPGGFGAWIKQFIPKKG